MSTKVQPRLDPKAQSNRHPYFTNSEIRQKTEAQLQRVVHPNVEATDQIVDAIGDLSRDPVDFAHWPWEPVDALVGAMAPGEIHFIAAFSGVGKTTFAASAINRFIDLQQRVYVMPLELRPKTFRTILACQRLGIRPGDALSGALRAKGYEHVKPLEDALRAQWASEAGKYLRVCGASRITAAGLKECMYEAYDWNANVVVVDHIDQIAAGDGKDFYAESRLVCETAADMAQELGLKIVFTTQLNNDAAKGQDRLQRFAAPRPEWVKMGGHKREIASSMLGIYRPLRAPNLGESEDAYRDKLRGARNGEIEPSEVLARNTMGIILMKSRNFGDRDGNSCHLRVWNGAVCERIPEH